VLDGTEEVMIDADCNCLSTSEIFVFFIIFGSLIRPFSEPAFLDVCEDLGLLPLGIGGTEIVKYYARHSLDCSLNKSKNRSVHTEKCISEISWKTPSRWAPDEKRCTELTQNQIY
jgi:hypothetical protein